MKKLVAALAALVATAALSLNAADGAAIYKKDCAKCHGADGKGQTAMGKKLKVKDYTDAKVQASLKDEEMIKATKEGVKQDGKVVMKGYGDTLKDEEIKAVVKYIREFKK